MPNADLRASLYMEGIHFQTGEPIAVHIEDGRIGRIESLQTTDQHDLPYIGPGLVDLQINGFAGFDFNTIPIPDGSIQDITRALWAEGVTSYFPTIITNSDDAITNGLQAIAAACTADENIAAAIAGIHLEGPFLSPEDGPRGAHNREFIKAPDWDLFQTWQEAAAGLIKIITISPEWPESIEFIQKCIENGVTVSLGHTAATPEQIQAAVSAGARMSTHLGNGAHLMLPRHPNYIWEQLADDRVWSCLIADGFHLPDSFLKVALRAKREQAMLVSDAVFLSGMPPGEYDIHIGGKVVLTAEGKLHLADNDRLLAGSAQSLRWGIGNMVKKGLSSLSEAWEMASTRPATFMELSAQVGLQTGAPADLVSFAWKSGTLQVMQTCKNGVIVYDSSELKGAGK